MPFTVAIAGISSRLAQLITSHLLAIDNNVHIRGSCRDPSRLSSPFVSSSRYTPIRADPLDVKSLRELVLGADVVLCCYFADTEIMVSGQKLLIDLCEEASVPRYIASDFTLDYRGLDFGDIPMKDPMKVVQAHLESKMNVKGVHVLVGMFMETFWTAFEALDVRTATMRYWGKGTEKFDMTSLKTVSEFVSEVIMDKSATGFLKFRGDSKGMLELADDLEQVYNLKIQRSKFEHLPEASPVQRMLEVTSNLLRDGKIGLGKDLDNYLYPRIKAETTRDFLNGRSIIQLVKGESNVQAQISLV